MTRLAPSAAFRARLRAAADQPPLRPRLPLWWRGRRIGSLEPEVLVRAGVPVSLVSQDAHGWHVQGELTASMERIATVMRDAGVASVWRDEQIAIRDEAGAMLGSVERAVMRPLGIATQAVHLVAVDASGRHWIQQRAFDNPSDPGLWDTLVGGMVPAAEPLDVALERESWEEAGLRREQLLDLRHGGSVFLRRPLSEVPHGYAVQEVVWYASRLAEGVEPRNQDGEVAAFACVGAEEVTRMLERDEFTVDAAMVLLAAFGD